jgi:ribose transport system substrate-binding protein
MAPVFGRRHDRTANYKKDGTHTICFFNEGIFNPWRVVGMNNFTAEAELHKDKIKEVVILDDEGKDDK